MSSCRVLLIVLVSLTALVQQSGAAGPESAGKAIQEYLIVGTVVWPNAASALITIRGTSLIGRQRLEVKSYHVEPPGALADLHPGDRITAVFSEKDGMLHRLRRIVQRDPY